jgi:hypothetical protein
VGRGKDVGQRKGDLSGVEQWLLEIMQKINFGQIEDLAMQKGQPVLEPAPKIVREVKFGARSGPRRETGKEDFALKGRVIEMIENLRAIGSGKVRRLEVRDGLPFRMIVEEEMSMN